MAIGSELSHCWVLYPHSAPVARPPTGRVISALPLNSVSGPDRDPAAARRVVYLLGAGATQGAVSFAGSPEKLIMPGLIDRLLERMHEQYALHFADHPGIGHLVNEVVDTKTDFEHLLTFLADTPSQRFQDFAESLKSVFSAVLRAALEKVRRDVGEQYSDLYAVLVDMHQVKDSGESLAGFLTLNYDSILEHAIHEKLDRGIDYGIRTIGNDAVDAIPVLKLHGSFSWRHSWPVEVVGEIEGGLWIPPGIRKAKADYPFNAIWGAARELLDCDVLRIIGCNLGPNDWDLVSLLFTTMHGREAAPPYDVEVIGWPSTASGIAEMFPYLSVRSLLELPEIGPQLIGELQGGAPTEYAALDEREQERALEDARTKIENPFERWLRLKGELMWRDLGSLATHHGHFEQFVEAAP